MSCLGFGCGRGASYLEYVGMLSTHEESHGGRPHAVPAYDGLALTASRPARLTPFGLAEYLLDNVAELTDVAGVQPHQPGFTGVLSDMAQP